MPTPKSEECGDWGNEVASQTSVAGGTVSSGVY